MAKYLVKARFSAQGASGILKEGGTSRRDTIGKLIGDLGGSVEAFYFAFGETDVFTIIDLPDNVTATALALRVGASGAVGIETVVLITPEEVDQAIAKSVDYRPPGA